MSNVEKNYNFENFPLWMIAIADAVAFGIYIIGAYIMFKLGLIWGLLYLLYCLFVEIRVMRGSCIYCYYYGKLCGLGRGKLASLFFVKGDPDKFIHRNLSWKDLIPDLLVALIPFIAGIYLLFKTFSWPLLALIALLFILATAGTGFVRTNFACNYCRQRKLGCPAEKLFNKKGN